MRLATDNDLTRIVEIYNSTIPTRLATADLEPVSVEDKRKWFETHSANRPIFVEDIDSDLAGWLSFESFYGRPAYHLTAEISLYLDSRFRGRGLGKRMLSEGISKASGLGLENLVAYIFSHNAPSISLFKKHGFVTWGELPGIADMDGERYSLTILGLKLDP